jgi:UDP-N-acetylmuramate dehydrogenase
MPQAPPFVIQDEPLAPYTTIGLGGPARLFAPCTTRDELAEALAYADSSGIPVHLLSGGSNTIFADEGFDGLVIHLRIRGVDAEVGPDGAAVRAACGEPWDDIVAYAVSHDWQGIECLSGIPGSVGASPVQNVGAYGQEVAETISSVTALDRSSLVPVRFTGDECGFGYRKSRFKGEDAGRFVITEVEFRLQVHGVPRIRYGELRIALEARGPGEGARPSLRAVRNTVLALRRGKSMVHDPADENVRSVGSFFMNPVVSAETADRLRGENGELPQFPGPDGVKLSAAWLIEHAGFPRGLRRGGAGISTRHTLALVNRGGTTKELLALAAEIQRGVFDRFGVRLEREPSVIPYRG